MYTLSRNLHITTGITFLIVFIMKFSCSLFASYPLVGPHDRAGLLPSVNAGEVNRYLHELTSYHAFNRRLFDTSTAVDQSERELIEKLSRGTLSLPVIFAQMCALIKHKKAEAPECTALMRVYQAAVLQQAINDPSKKSDIDHIISFIKTGADVTHIDKEGNSALHRAAKEGNGAAVQFFIPLFAQRDLLEARGVFGQTALHCAAVSGNVDCIKALLDAGAHLEATDKDGERALHTAARYGNVGAVQFLTPLFAKNGLLEMPTFDEQTALHNAAKNGSVECIRELLDAGAKLTATDRNGCNALHYAVLYEKGAATEFLIPLFAKIGLLEAPGYSRRTALHDAAYSGDVKCIKALLDAGAKFNVIDEDGFNPLHLASLSGKTAATLFLTPLFSLYGLLDAPSGNGKTPLGCAHRAGHEIIVALLWALGASRPLNKEELPAALQRAITVMQNLAPDEFDRLIAALETLHEMNIRVPASLTPPFSSDQELFLPLRNAILERLTSIQKKIREGLHSPFLPELKKIV